LAFDQGRGKSVIIGCGSEGRFALRKPGRRVIYELGKEGKFPCFIVLCASVSEQKVLSEGGRGGLVL